MRGLLSHADLVLLARANALAPQVPDILSDFEKDLVRDVGARFLKWGRLAPLTPAERQVLIDVERALTAAARVAFAGERAA